MTLNRKLCMLSDHFISFITKDLIIINKMSIETISKNSRFYNTIYEKVKFHEIISEIFPNLKILFDPPLFDNSPMQTTWNGWYDSSLSSRIYVPYFSYLFLYLYCKRLLDGKQDMRIKCVSTLVNVFFFVSILV